MEIGGPEGIRAHSTLWPPGVFHEGAEGPRRPWQESNRLYVETLTEPDYVRDHTGDMDIAIIIGGGVVESEGWRRVLGRLETLGLERTERRSDLELILDRGID